MFTYNLYIGEFHNMLILNLIIDIKIYYYLWTSNCWNRISSDRANNHTSVAAVS